MSRTPRTPIEADLNQEGDAGTCWGNLGLWQPGDSYPAAAERLASRIAAAAGLAPGQRVLDLGMGSGQQWALWRERFEVASIVGIDADADACAHAARFASPADRIVHARAGAVTGMNALGAFDAALAVDAAYHFEDRPHLLATLARHLTGTGRAAWSDLVLAAGQEPPEPVVALLLRSAGIAPDSLMSAENYASCLHAANWRDVRIEHLDAEVLDGFALWWPRYRKRHRVNTRMWLRAELTARFLRANMRSRRLGYVLVSACAPNGPQQDSRAG